MGTSVINMPDHPILKIWHGVAAALVISLCSGSFGYGVSQATISRQVYANQKDIEALKAIQVAETHTRDADFATETSHRREDIAALRMDFVSERARTDERIKLVAALLTESIGESRSLIALIKAQQQIVK